MTHKSVLLDTSFFLRFLNEQDPLFRNADRYYKYFLQQDFPLVISTIAIAEYCVRGKVEELPLKNLRVLPFNLPHAVKAGDFAEIVFSKRSTLNLPDRRIIPNDTKLFAQAHMEEDIGYYLSSDLESKKIYDMITGVQRPTFQFIDLYQPHSAVFGLLDF
jgi:predicted nucleic acid-binding protein